MEQATAAVPELGPFIERYAAAWNACDTSAMAELVTEDIVWADPALPAPARGIPEVQEFMRTSFRAFPDLVFSEPDPRVVASDGDLVLWRWRMEGTHEGPLEPPGFAPTCARMGIDGIDHWVFRDGRIAEYRAFYDLADLSRQLGLMPAPGSGAERSLVRLQRLGARMRSRRR